MNMIWHNGDFKPEDTPILTAHDRVLRGDGVFDTLLVVDGKPAHAKRHMARLIEHAEKLSINIDHSAITLETILDRFLGENKLNSGKYALNTTITRGPAPRGLSVPDTQTPNVIMRASALSKAPTEIRALISKTVKRNEYSPLSNIKSLNYGDNIMALIDAKNANCNEAILMNTHDHVACTTTGNIFILNGETLYTPPLEDGAMDGIARALLIEEYGAREERLEEEDIKNAEGLFIANSVRGLQSISMLNGLQLEMQKPDVPADFHF